MPTGSDPTSPTPPHSNANSVERKNSLETDNNGGNKLSSASYDATPYIQRARVTRPTPPKPSCNPMQFVQIKPCNLYQSAQQQLKRAEEVKKVKEIKKEEPEDWQSNLDNWKSSRRKRVEHIIDRVVEVKKLEMEEHDRTRRKSKTFSEMLEERGTRRKISTLAVYNEDEANDFSDLGIGTSSASGKSSLSEDYDNHSVISDNADAEKHSFDIDNNSNHENGGNNRDYIPSPGYDTSSSTAPASSPDPCEYTYEGAIQDYKTRISRAQSSTNSGYNNGFRNSLPGSYSKDSTPERSENGGGYLPLRRMSNSRLEDRLINFEVKSNEQNIDINVTALKKDLPKVDITKRRELFEKENSSSTESMMNGQKRYSGDFSNSKSIKERLSSLEKKPDDININNNIAINNSINKKTNRLSGDISSIKDRLQHLEKQNSVTEKSPKIDVPVVPLKDRLSSLNSAVKKEETKKPVVLVDEHQLEILKKEEASKRSALQKQQQQHLQEQNENTDDDNLNSSQEILNIQDESNIDTDREDSGIHTTDVSCSVSQTDEQPELVNEETHHHINEDGLCHQIQEPEEQLEQIIERDPNDNHNHCIHQEENDKQDDTSIIFPDVVPIEITSDIVETNVIEKIHNIQPWLENDEDDLKIDENISSTITTPSTTAPMSIQSPEPPTETIDLETSVNEALELALQAIDNENTNETIIESNQLSQTSIENKQETDLSNCNSNDKHPSMEALKSIMRQEHIYENIDKKPQTNQQPIDESNKIISPTSQQPISNGLIIDTIKHNDYKKKTDEVIISTKTTVNNNHNIIMNGDLVDRKESNEKVKQIEDEPYYQVPKSSEPYYEVPKYTKPIPVYENIEIFYPGTGNEGYPIGSINMMEPPKEKPPPPPIDNDNTDDDEGGSNDHSYEVIIRNSANNNNNNKQKELNQNGDINGQPIKRMNSTKRIKKELRNKRSSFLGIEGSTDDDTFLELTVAPPPDMAQLLQEERRLEKQLYMKAGLYESSDTGDSRDSGVSENHSRQSSEPFTTSSEEQDDLLAKKEKEIIEVLEKEEEKRRNVENWSINEDDAKMRCIEDQIREQEEVLRVERELLQLEQEELKRQRENLILRENLARRELQHGAKMLMSANHCQSLQDINASSGHYANLPNQIYRIETDYRKSMSDLQDFGQKRPPPPPAPPAKPLRSHLSIDSATQHNTVGLVKIASNGNHISKQQIIQHSQSTDEFVPLRNYQPHSAIHHGNMTRHTLHALSATPKPKFTDGWIHTKKSPEKSSNDTWLSYQQKRKSVPEGFNYNKHWLIQEAEQRRIDQQRGIRNNAINGQWTTNNSSAIQRNGSSDNKPLPDSVIQTLTQRVQSKGIGERKRLDAAPLNDAKILSTASSITSLNTQQPKSTLPEGQQEKVLSVSGKKKCSHCGEELGRGAAMIIESLRLFYHIDCFKCCVCHVQLGDGLNGTDVRVRNQKLHCHNCYSSDDGIKFSCV